VTVTGRYRWKVQVTFDYPEPQTDIVQTAYGSDFVVAQDDSTRPANHVRLCAVKCEQPADRRGSASGFAARTAWRCSTGSGVHSR
jgi:hypothetical protein